jgi:hypothetical protein
MGADPSLGPAAQVTGKRNRLSAVKVHLRQPDAELSQPDADMRDLDAQLR